MKLRTTQPGSLCPCELPQGRSWLPASRSEQMAFCFQPPSQMQVCSGPAAKQGSERPAWSDPQHSSVLLVAALPCPAPLTSRDAFPPVDLGEERRAGGRVVAAGARGGRSRRGRRARGGRRSPCGGSGWRFSPFCCYRTLKEASKRKGRCTSSTSAAITTQQPPGEPCRRRQHLLFCSRSAPWCDTL